MYDIYGVLSMTAAIHFIWNILVGLSSCFCFRWCYEGKHTHEHRIISHHFLLPLARWNKLLAIDRKVTIERHQVYAICAQCTKYFTNKTYLGPKAFECGITASYFGDEFSKFFFCIFKRYKLREWDCAYVYEQLSMSIDYFGSKLFRIDSCRNAILHQSRILFICFLCSQIHNYVVAQSPTENLKTKR